MSFKKIDDYLGRALEIIITICLSAVVIITFLQVVFRYVFKQPLGWSQEVLMVCFVYSVLFGAALAIKNSEHLQVNIFEKMPKMIEKVFKALEFTVVIVVIVCLLYFGFGLVMDNFDSGQVLGMVPIKKAYVYMAIPISALFMLYYQIKKVYK